MAQDRTHTAQSPACIHKYDETHTTLIGAISHHKSHAFGGLPYDIILENSNNTSTET